jgi:hypothetical protein
MLPTELPTMPTNFTGALRVLVGALHLLATKPYLLAIVGYA